MRSQQGHAVEGLWSKAFRCLQGYKVVYIYIYNYVYIYIHTSIIFSGCLDPCLIWYRDESVVLQLQHGS